MYRHQTANEDMKQNLTQLQAHIDTVAGHVNTTFSVFSRQKVRKKIRDLNNSAHQIGLLDIYRICFKQLKNTYFLENN